MVRELVVIGYGMVGHHLVSTLRARDDGDTWRVTVLGEEPCHAYDRVGLSEYLRGRDASRLALGDGFVTDPMVRTRTGTAAVAVDRSARTVTTASGETLGYDALVLATGSRPVVPPVEGMDLPGCFTYRTIEDLERIHAAARAGARSGVVVGGGLLGLEAANALRVLGMRTHVVEVAEHLMPVQVDSGGGGLLNRLVGELGVRVHCGDAVRTVDGHERVSAVSLRDGTVVGTDMVVLAAGIRPRGELATAAGLEVDDGGGVLVDDHCRTGDRRVWAVGECASVEGRRYGLLAPGRAMAELVVDQLLRRPFVAFTGADTATKLKLLGVDVASFGDSHAESDGAVELARDTGDTYAKLVLDSEAERVLGGVFVGDTAPYGRLRALLGRELPSSPEHLLR